MTHRFLLSFTQEGNTQVTAKLVADEQTGVEEDNVRHTMIRVVKNVKVLVIDGAYPDHLKASGDTVPLETALNSSKGYLVDKFGPDRLDTPNLDEYPSIYLLNVPKLKDKGLKNLEDYVARGGRVAFFMGDKVEPSYYNQTLYNAGKGLLPVPIESKPVPKLADNERQDRLKGDQFLLFVRDHYKHQIFAGLAECEPALRFLLIDQYFRTLPRSTWAHQPGKGVIRELATLPSRGQLADYAASARELYKRLPTDEAKDPKFKKYAPGLRRHQKAIEAACLPGNQLYQLSNAFTALLEDTGDSKNPVDRPNLVDFWNLEEVKQLRSDVEQFRDAIQYGDPLVLTKRYGNGRVVQFLTTAGRSWNDWSGGSMAQFTYPMVIGDLQKYLTATGDDISETAPAADSASEQPSKAVRPISDDQSHMIGETVEIRRDATRYEPRMKIFYSPGLPGASRPGQGKAPGKEGGTGAPSRDEDQGEIQATPSGKELLFTFKDVRKAGMYRLKLLPRPIGPEPAVQEELPFVYNVDAVAESNLRRAARDHLEKEPAADNPNQGRVRLVASDSDLHVFRQRQADMSESPWLYLIFLIVLVVEQALAVHLSFHLKGGGQATLPAQAVGPQASAA
jgi:hypothetical protein